VSEILERWRAGEGLPAVLTIDGHTHVHAWPHGPNFDTFEEMAAAVVAFMDANGVDASCVLSGGYMQSGCDYTLGNDVLLELAKACPDRIIGFAHVNPNDHLDHIITELARIFEMGFRCIKLLNSYQQSYPGDGPHLMAVYRFADERNMLILNHAWTEDELRKIAAEFPNTDFIMGHYSSSRDPLLEEFPNVYASIWNLGSLGFIERGVQNVGPEKFLFGSDAFMNAMSVGIGLVVYARIPDEHKRMILGLNQARLLDKVGALPAGLKAKYAV